MAAIVLCRRELNDIGEPVRYCAKPITRKNSMDWCEPCHGRLPFWPADEPCGAPSCDDRRCYLPEGHAPPHIARCGSCGEHRWPEPENSGTHAEALRLDVALADPVNQGAR